MHIYVYFFIVNLLTKEYKIVFLIVIIHEMLIKIRNVIDI